MSAPEHLSVCIMQHGMCFSSRRLLGKENVSCSVPRCLDGLCNMHISLSLFNLSECFWKTDVEGSVIPVSN